MSPQSTRTMKLQSLGFTTKRSGATFTAKAKGSKSPITTPSTPDPIAVTASTQAGDAALKDEEKAAPSVTRRKTRAAAKAQPVEEEKVAGKKRKLQEVEKASIKQDKPKKKGEDKGKRVFRSRVSLENVEGREAEARDDASSSDIEPDESLSLDTSEKAKKTRALRHYGKVRAKMGYLNPIHAEGQQKEQHILRVFDLSYEYGPCIGMTRLQRWERAEAMGLKPPFAVKEILLDDQAKESRTLGECVFFDEA
ncbi:DNA polymerase delta, subunit 4-domain-containing protein [Cytidiella melzeri]|nr:DNA polymerase delta, subunit 4-domain-containing protein [Cytidiella melzeri]